MTPFDRLRFIFHLRLRPKWKMKRNLSELVGKTVSLRFRFTLADVYAFQVTR